MPGGEDLTVYEHDDPRVVADAQEMGRLIVLDTVAVDTEYDISAAELQAMYDLPASEVSGSDIAGLEVAFAMPSFNEDVETDTKISDVTKTQPGTSRPARSNPGKSKPRQNPGPKSKPQPQKAADPKTDDPPGLKNTSTADSGATPPPTPDVQPQPVKSADQEQPKLGLRIGVVRDALDHIAEAAKDQIEAEKRDIGEKIAQGTGKLAKARNYLRLFKYASAFRAETERQRGETRMAKLLEQAKTRAGGRLDIAEFMQIVHGNSVSPKENQEKALIGVVIDDKLRRNGDVVKSSTNEANEPPHFKEMRGKVTALVLAYIEKTDPSKGLDDAVKEQARADFETSCNDYFAEFIQTHPELGIGSADAFNVLASDCVDLAEETRALKRHDGSMDDAKAALEQLKLSIGSVKVGAETDYDTKYLEKTLSMMKTRRVASVVGKAAIMVGAGAVLAIGANMAARSLITKGARIGGVALGTAVLGPIGIGVGLAAGSVVAGAYAGYMHLKEARETIKHVDVKSSDMGDSFISSALVEQLAYEKISAPEKSQALRAYLTDPNADITGKLELRSDITGAEYAQLVKLLAEIDVKVSAQNNDPTGNYIKYSDPSLVLSELSELTNLRSKIFDILQTAYATEQMPINDTDKTVFTQYFAAQLTERQITHNTDVATKDIARKDFKKTKFWRGFKWGAAGALAGGTLFQAGSELVSHGDATTVFDAFRSGNAAAEAAAPSTGTANLEWGKDIAHITPDGNAKINIPENFDVKYSANSDGTATATISSKEGLAVFNGKDSTEVTISSDGSIVESSAKDIYASGGMITEKGDGPHGEFSSFDDYWRAGKGERPEFAKAEVSRWLTNGNNTPNGNELGARIGHIDHAGGARFSVHMNGESFDSSGYSANPVELAEKGKLYIAIGEGDHVIMLKAKVGDNGEIGRNLPSWAKGLYHTNSEGRTVGPTWRVVSKNPDGTLNSFATAPGNDSANLNITGGGAKTIDIHVPLPSGDVSGAEAFAVTGDNLNVTLPYVPFVPVIDRKDNMYVYGNDTQGGPGDAQSPSQQPTPPSPDTSSGGGLVPDIQPTTDAQQQPAQGAHPGPDASGGAPTQPPEVQPQTPQQAPAQGGAPASEPSHDTTPVSSGPDAAEPTKLNSSQQAVIGSLKPGYEFSNNNPDLPVVIRISEITPDRVTIQMISDPVGEVGAYRSQPPASFVENMRNAGFDLSKPINVLSQEPGPAVNDSIPTAAENTAEASESLAASSAATSLSQDATTTITPNALFDPESLQQGSYYTVTNNGLTRTLIYNGYDTSDSKYLFADSGDGRVVRWGADVLDIAAQDWGLSQVQSPQATASAQATQDADTATDVAIDIVPGYEPYGSEPTLMGKQIEVRGARYKIIRQRVDSKLYAVENSDSGVKVGVGDNPSDEHIADILENRAVEFERGEAARSEQTARTVTMPVRDGSAEAGYSSGPSTETITITLQPQKPHTHDANKPTWTPVPSMGYKRVNGGLSRTVSIGEKTLVILRDGFGDLINVTIQGGNRPIPLTYVDEKGDTVQERDASIIELLRPLISNS